MAASLRTLIEESSLCVPISEELLAHSKFPFRNFKASHSDTPDFIVTPAHCYSLPFQPHKPYHTSALVNLAIDTITLPSR